MEWSGGQLLDIWLEPTPIRSQLVWLLNWWSYGSTAEDTHTPMLELRREGNCMYTEVLSVTWLLGSSVESKSLLAQLQFAVWTHSCRANNQMNLLVYITIFFSLCTHRWSTKCFSVLGGLQLIRVHGIERMDVHLLHDACVMSCSFSTFHDSLCFCGASCVHKLLSNSWLFASSSLPSFSFCFLLLLVLVFLVLIPELVKFQKYYLWGEVVAKLSGHYIITRSHLLAVAHTSIRVFVRTLQILLKDNSEAALSIVWGRRVWEGGNNNEWVLLLFFFYQCCLIKPFFVFFSFSCSVFPLSTREGLPFQQCVSTLMIFPLFFFLVLQFHHPPS